MRRRLIAGNWKMNLTIPEAKGLVDTIIKGVGIRTDLDVVVCPPFTALGAVHEEVRPTNVLLGAQGMFWRDNGAFTGQISPAMLVALHCEYVILGHSEARGRFGEPDSELRNHIGYFAESDETVNLKVRHALYHNLKPIVCVGETLAERDAGKTDEVIVTQLERALSGIDPDEMYELVVAYEPVWAIGTGQICDAQEAERVCAHIRKTQHAIADGDAATSLRVLYGGSVKANNSAQLLRQENIDGALVGGASLDAEEFKAIVMNA